MGEYTHPSDDFTDDPPEVILARCIFGEARSESEKGKYAVAFVVKNRTKVKDATYHEIILQPKQFSCFNPGDPNLAKLKDPEKEDPEAWKLCLEIAAVVVACNQDKNPVDGATHYYNPNAASPGWKDEGREVARIGKHVFRADIRFPSPPKLPRKEVPVDPNELERIGQKNARLKELFDLIERANSLKLGEELTRNLAAAAAELSKKILAEVTALDPPKPGQPGGGPAPEPGSGSGGSGSGTGKPSEPRKYKVKRGDTLSEIAQRFGTTVDELKKLNPGITDPDKLTVGQEITLPGG